MEEMTLWNKEADEAEGCPVCLMPYTEDPAAASARAVGAFSCTHSICLECSRGLIATAAEYRCPTCRAEAADPAPEWLHRQRVDPALVTARCHAVEREREEHRLAQQEVVIAVLGHVLGGSSSPTADQNVADLRRIIDRPHWSRDRILLASFVGDLVVGHAIRQLMVERGVTRLDLGQGIVVEDDGLQESDLE